MHRGRTRTLDHYWQNPGRNPGRKGRCRGSWEGDTKCINVPPQTLLRRVGEQRLQPGTWGAPAISLPDTPQERALPETARWEGPAAGRRQELRGADQQGTGEVLQLPSPVPTLAPQTEPHCKEGSWRVLPEVPGPKGCWSTLSPATGPGDHP